MGVCYDNLGHFKKAMTCYQSFAEVLQGSEDKFAEALAHNCIGVGYQLLAKGLERSLRGEDRDKKGDEITPAERQQQYLQLALQHHNIHCKFADGAGQFLAHSNMGLCYDALDDLAHAADEHQQALRNAIQLSSLSGQCMAIGNLGMTALKGNDLGTARACMERHLQLTASLGDSTGEVHALRLLGEIASQQGQHEEASQLFMESVSNAAVPQSKDPERNTAKVKVGIARANAVMEEKMREMAEQIQKTQLEYPTDPEPFENLNYIETPRNAGS
jgi:tetratricopeptide (TPR) repeat protein